MGGFAPSAAMAAVQMGLDVARREAAANAQRADAKSQARVLRQAQQAEERARQERLRRALAAQRARFGAQGLGESGSGAAVLAGLAAASERQALDRDRLTNIRLQRLGSLLNERQRQSLLQSSQAYARQLPSLLHYDP